MRSTDLPSASRTSSARIAQQLRADIISGRVHPGSRLKVQELADRYGTSSMPVREAIRVLEGERLLDFSPNRGATVRPVTISFVRDVYEVRAVLEEIQAASAVRAATSADIEELERLAEGWDTAARAGASPAAILAANGALHGRIAAIGTNEEARAILDRGWPLLESLRKQIGYGERRLEDISDQHHAIVSSIASRDESLARRAAREHCFSARDDLIDRLDHVAGLEVSRTGASIA